MKDMPAGKPSDRKAAAKREGAGHAAADGYKSGKDAADGDGSDEEKGKAKAERSKDASAEGSGKEKDEKKSDIYAAVAAAASAAAAAAASALNVTRRSDAAESAGAGREVTASQAAEDGEAMQLTDDESVPLPSQVLYQAMKVRTKIRV
jgi:hypothetical protein